MGNNSELYTYLQKEWYKNNLPKYYKYFDSWQDNLTVEQIAGFTKHMLNGK